jgi:hypothetical protein
LVIGAISVIAERQTYWTLGYGVLMMFINITSCGARIKKRCGDLGQTLANKSLQASIAPPIFWGDKSD